MITIIDGKMAGPALESFNYIRQKGIFTRMVLPVTRYLRAINAERYTAPADRHLDIGCGDGYFLKRSTCRERYGLDTLLGDHVTDRIDFPNGYFDYVTLLAVIEHVDSPEPLLNEIARVLKGRGKLIITTPKARAHAILKTYANEVDDEHVRYYDRDYVVSITKKDFILKDYRTFLFGLNQVFCLEKR